MTTINTSRSISSQTDNSYTLDIQAECVNVLYQQAYIILAGNLASSLGLGLLFYNSYLSPIILIWIAAIYTLTFVRFIMVWNFRKLQQKYTSPEILTWGKYFSLTSLLSGLLWAVASYIFFIPDNFLLLAFHTMLITAMLVASISSLSAVLPAYYNYAIPVGLTLVIQYTTYGSYEFLLFGCLLAVFLFIQLAYARINNRMLVESIKLRFENINLIKQLQNQTAQALDAKRVAETANETKTKFLAVASHDLRQPLHALGLFISVMENILHTDRQKDVLLKIKRSTKALRELLDSLLDISKIDAGVIKYESRSFAVQTLFESLQDEFETYSEKKNITLKFKSTGFWVYSDYRIVERILRNLISNAIRYTHNGGVLTGCRVRGNSIVLSVYDTGIGIPEDKMDEIFIEFKQLANPGRDRTRGLGLGLAIVQRLSTMMNTRINSASITGKGSVFSIELPRANPEINVLTANRENTNQHIFMHKTILIVDDEMDIIEGLIMLLSGWQCRVITANSGKMAVEKILADGIFPDLALIDYRLRSSETGIDVINSIRSLSTDRQLPVIITTGDTEPELIKLIESAGYRVLHKPIPASRLRAIMTYMLTNQKPKTD